jgi:hypothetical protein
MSAAARSKMPNFLPQMKGQFRYKTRTQRMKGKKEPITKYYITYGACENNLSHNLGDLRDSEDYCVLLTEPRLFPGASPSAPKSALVGFHPKYKEYFDEIRMTVRSCILDNKVLGKLTLPALFDPEDKESRLERVWSQKDDADRPATSIKFPEDTRYYVIEDQGADGRARIVELTNQQQINEYLVPGTRFICKINWASLHTVGDTLGCSRYMNWVAFFPRDAKRKDEEVVLGMDLGAAEVVEGEAAAPPEQTESAAAAAAAGDGDLDEFQAAVASGFDGAGAGAAAAEDEDEGESLAKRARKAGL